ncbi:MAG: hypothetical protein P1V81_03355 [Planctomycetota bacterium]|nr:hypothetical protein [Planctomycetota bacterium]
MPHRPRSHAPRSPWLLVLIAGLMASCVSPPTAEELLDVGFRSPEQAFRTYQTAMAGDHLDLEYRCLSAKFRADNQIDGLVYRLGREELLKRQPFVKLLADGKIEASRELAPDLVELEVKVSAMFVTKRIRVWMVRVDYYEAWRGEQLAFDAFANFQDHVFLEKGDPDQMFGIVAVPEGEDGSSVTELRFGREWRIAGFELMQESPDPTADSIGTVKTP